jgi:DNA-binding IclR family transcriptional regulator
MTTNDRIVFVMSTKYAQRRSADDLAGQLKLMPSTAYSRLASLERRGLVRRWTDGTWNLTPIGNMRRHELTALPL